MIQVPRFAELVKRHDRSRVGYAPFNPRLGFRRKLLANVFRCTCHPGLLSRLYEYVLGARFLRGHTGWRRNLHPERNQDMKDD
jgi:hypothetical protein